MSKQVGYTTELDLYKTVNLYNTIQYTSGMDDFSNQFLLPIHEMEQIKACLW